MLFNSLNHSVDYTSIDERHLPFYSTVISSSEREAHYVIDGLMKDDIIKSSIHSTDSHGCSEYIFSCMHLLGISFAPRIKRFNKNLIYGFKARSVYINKNYTIIPDGKINKKIIIDNWEDILRFIVTIKLKESTASQLFNRMNSYSSGLALYKAIQEFGKIPKTIFHLRYIDELQYRQSIEKQLNKIESYNKFAKAISVGTTKSIPYSSKEEQEIGEACKRYILNSLICWNYMFVSNLLIKEKNPLKKSIIIESLKSGSIIRWRQFNFYGEYDFSGKKMEDSIGFNISQIKRLKIP